VLAPRRERVRAYMRVHVCVYVRDREVRVCARERDVLASNEREREQR